MPSPRPLRPGRHLPPGATLDAGGVNFSLFARQAAAVELRLYASADSAEPFQVIALDPALNRTFFFWHVYVEGLPAGVAYTWRVAQSAPALASAPELLDPLRGALDELRPLQETIAGLDPRVIDEEELHEFGDPDMLLFNVNEPADLDYAEKILREGYP